MMNFFNWLGESIDRLAENKSEKTWADWQASPITDSRLIPQWMKDRNKVLNANPMIRIYKDDK